MTKYNFPFIAGDAERQAIPQVETQRCFAVSVKGIDSKPLLEARDFRRGENTRTSSDDRVCLTVSTHTVELSIANATIQRYTSPSLPDDDTSPSLWIPASPATKNATYKHTYFIGRGVPPRHDSVSTPFRTCSRPNLPRYRSPLVTKCFIERSLALPPEALVLVLPHHYIHTWRSPSHPSGLAKRGKSHELNPA